MQINRYPNSNRFCGPAALAALTGAHVDDAAQALRIATGKRAIKGVRNVEMLKAFALLGHRAVPIPTDKIHLLTLAGVLRTTLASRGSYQRFLINVTGHYVAVQGRKLWDNKNPEGVFLGAYNHRRVRVKAIWEVIPS